MKYGGPCLKGRISGQMRVGLSIVPCIYVYMYVCTCLGDCQHGSINEHREIRIESRRDIDVEIKT
mgnify:CR=1 FL=1